MIYKNRYEKNKSGLNTGSFIFRHLPKHLTSERTCLNDIPFYLFCVTPAEMHLGYISCDSINQKTDK